MELLLFAFGRCVVLRWRGEFVWFFGVTDFWSFGITLVAVLTDLTTGRQPAACGLQPAAGSLRPAAGSVNGLGGGLEVEAGGIITGLLTRI